VLEVLYHRAKFGGAWISPAAGAPENVEFFVRLSVCLSVCLSVRHAGIQKTAKIGVFQFTNKG